MKHLRNNTVWTSTSDTELAWVISRLNVIASQLNSIRKGSGYRSRRRLLRREYDELWALFVAAKLAEK